MNREEYSHSPIVHVFGIGIPCFLGYLAYQPIVEVFVKNDIVPSIGLAILCIMLAILVIWLYMRSGLNRYAILESGLEVKKIGARSVYPWTDIKRVRLNGPLHYFVIEGNQSVIAFSSIDYFPNVEQMIVQIYRLSNCELSPNLKPLLENDG